MHAIACVLVFDVMLNLAREARKIGEAVSREE